jgi:hypothetical protein
MFSVFIYLFICLFIYVAAVNRQELAIIRNLTQYNTLFWWLLTVAAMLPHAGH